MSYPLMDLWQDPPADLLPRLRDRLVALLDAAPGPVELTFRADDHGVAGKAVRRMLEPFARHDLPLALAVVPAWLPMGAKGFREMIAPHANLSLIVHGWRHTNHEPAGKKQEFGPARSRAVKRAELARGLEIMERHLDHFAPIFTPPWNRCDGETLELLAELGFAGVSRFVGAKPVLPEELAPKLAEPDMNVDLHTRKDPDPEAGLAGILGQMQAGIEAGRLGVMLHHTRMNGAAFACLDSLCKTLAGHPAIRPTRLESVGIDFDC